MLKQYYILLIGFLITLHPILKASTLFKPKGAVHIIAQTINDRLPIDKQLKNNDVIVHLLSDSISISQPLNVSDNFIWAFFDDVSVGIYKLKATYKDTTSIIIDSIPVLKKKKTYIENQQLVVVQIASSTDPINSFIWEGSIYKSSKVKYNGLFQIYSIYPTGGKVNIYSEKVSKLEPSENDNKLTCTNGFIEYNTIIDSSSAYSLVMEAGSYFCYLNNHTMSKYMISTRDDKSTKGLIHFPNKSSTVNLYHSLRMR